jgi:hypothetical protein
MGETSLPVPEIDLYHTLRPWQGFEAAYQGLSANVPIYLCENNKPRDPEAELGVDGIDPNLIAGLPVRMGTRSIIWFPPILTIEGVPRGYKWVIEWRIRSCFDFRNSPKARMPFHGPKQGQGCPETVVNPGARVIIPASTETQIYVQTEPAGTTAGSDAHLRMVAIRSAGYQLSQPLLPGGALGVVQQGICPAAIAGRHMAQFLQYETETAGDDENVGGALAPLATHDELVRRIALHLGFGATSTGIDIYFVGDYVGDIDWEMARIEGEAFLRYHGERTVLYSGSVTGAAAYNPGASVAGWIRDAALPPAGFAPYVGKALVMTSGAISGSVGYIEKDLTDLTANYHPPFDSVGWTSGDPAIADTYDICQMTHVEGRARFTGPVNVILYDLWLDEGGSPYADSFSVHDRASVVASYCTIETGTITADTCSFLDLVGCRAAGGCGALQARGDSLVDLDGSTIETTLRSSSESWAMLWEWCTTWSNGLLSYAGIGSICIPSASWWGVFDMAAGTTGISTQENEFALLSGLFWGAGNASSYGLYAEAPSRMGYTTLPTYGPNTFDCYVGGLTTPYAGLPLINAAKMCGIVVYP